MKSLQVYHYDAFTSVPNQGNPAGIVLDAAGLSEEDMLNIARQVGFNETAFVLPSDQAAYRIRYFTPGHEMNLCGHATVASIFALYERGLLENTASLTVETKAGVLTIGLEIKDERLYVTMQQASPEFKPFEGSSADLAKAMDLEAADLDENYPILYGSTGIWTLIVPVRGLEAFARMKPFNERFPSVLQENPRASVHPICLETIDPAAHMHARHFSSPYSGTVEDPVTGTASGVMGAYWLKYIRPSEDEVTELLVEQGQEIGRDGRVAVRVVQQHDVMEVFIAGTAVYVKDLVVTY